MESQFDRVAGSLQMENWIGVIVSIDNFLMSVSAELSWSVVRFELTLIRSQD